MENKENLIKAIEKGKAEIKERKANIRRLQKKINELLEMVDSEKYDLRIAQEITTRLNERLHGDEGDE